MAYFLGDYLSASVTLEIIFLFDCTLVGDSTAFLLATAYFFSFMALEEGLLL